ncbi:hypothetical protein [Arthrobacter caoxuetaonis]|uniref:Uncharacterized protein n=1 Tax=Arthrobacter caoxuetaonis TaxID=2886935 RepID=A0A9X1SD32_9MICC|nr:hypothetical protein [Arthrobacter caoxuetaonis]MCC3299290.1 hypothetical protein [Arthrobacter caoxuetaonis]USQ59216.1 hypothetical protein NF551_16670 [Arthrobacter caoxuetaonis]
MGAIKHGKTGTSMVLAGRRPQQPEPERNKDECPKCKSGRRSPCVDYIWVKSKRKFQVKKRMVTHRTAGDMDTPQQD